MRWGLAPAAAGAAAGCLAAAAPARESAVFRRYWASNAAYLKNLAGFPELEAEVAPARALLASLPDAALSRLIATHTPVLVAAGAARGNAESFRSAGTDWTRYLGPDGCCRSYDEARRVGRELNEKRCADTVFAVVEGRRRRDGRRVRSEIVTGIIPAGLDEYEGVLIAADGRELPVAWTRGWTMQRGDPLARDPLDDRTHRFELNRLAGARNWTIARWSGQPPLQHVDPPVSAATCVADLAPR